jgi:hypothetical protein
MAMLNNEILIQYIRTPKKLEARIKRDSLGVPHAYIVESGNVPCGVLVATGKGQIGWSLCNSNDQFDPERGKSIAEARAGLYGNRSITEIVSKAPISIRQDIQKMYNRSVRFYK